MEALELLTPFQSTALWKLLMASVCGALIGIEREMKGRPAGLKTFSLVCVGSTLSMITNEYIYLYVSGTGGDASRMAAQVISGIGFLGAGTIMVTGNSQIRGLTTAASLWVTAAIGIAIGSGFYFGGLVCLLILHLSSRLYTALDRRVMAKSRIMKIYVEGTDEQFMLRLLEYFMLTEAKVLSLQRREENKWFLEDSAAMIEMDFGKKRKHLEVLGDIRSMKGIRYVDEI